MGSVIEIPSSQAATNYKDRSATDLVWRLDRIDETLTDDECAAAIAVLDGEDAAPTDLEKATTAARTIMRFYPRSDVDDPKAYALGMAAIMSEYPAAVLDRVSDPRTGIARRQKFLPRLAEIAEACDEEVNRRKRLRFNAARIMWLNQKGPKKYEEDFPFYRSLLDQVGFRLSA